MNKDTYVVCADVHASDYTAFSKPVEGKPYGSRLKTVLDALTTMFERAKNEDASRAIIVGDLYNERKSISPIVTKAVTETLLNGVHMQPKGFELDIVVGNHDQQDNSPVPPNSVDIFETYSTDDYPIHVYDTVTVDNNEDSGLIFVPYTEASMEFKEDISNIKLDEDKNYIMFAHIGMSGAKSGKWTHKLGGNYTLEDVRYEDMDLVMMGHYHWRQNLADNVMYTGDLVPLNFNDEGQDKGFFVVKKPNDKFEAEFVPTKSPKFITIDLKSYEDDGNLKDALKKNYVRVVTHNSKDTDTIREMIKESHVAVALETKQEIKQASRLDISAESSDSEIVKSYCDKYYPDVVKEAESYLIKAQEA